MHIHDCFPLDQLFDGAVANFNSIPAHRTGFAPVERVLLLAESGGADGFHQLKEYAVASSSRPKPTCGSWRIELTAEPASLRAVRTDGAELLVVAGRQIVARENLEVLALATDRRFPDAEPVGDTLVQVAEAGAIPVLPWGFGKWLGRRGRVLAQVLREPGMPKFWLGDNSGRLAGLPPPAEFRRAAELGIGVLPGSDPLPFYSQTRRAGAYGFLLPVAISREQPIRDLKSALACHQPLPYGRGERLLPFLVNQARMITAKHWRAPGSAHRGSR